MICHDLFSSFAKLQRARDLLHIIDQQIIQFTKEKTFLLRKEVSPDGSWRRFIMSGSFADDELISLALVCGDCIHNIRSALDHLVYGLAIRNTGENPPPRAWELQFPICKDPDDFRKRGSWIAPLSAEAKQFIEQLRRTWGQPACFLITQATKRGNTRAVPTFP